MKFINLKTKRFGRLTAISSERRMLNGTPRVFWKCRCICGQKITVSANHLTMGNTKSCGCWKIEAPKKLRQGLKHGAAVGGKITPLYGAWVSMKGRCCNPKHKSFQDY